MDTPQSGTVSLAIFSREVNRLLTGDFEEDEIDALIVSMHRQMASGNKALMFELALVALGALAPDEIDARGLALETLATARLPSLEPLVYTLIKACLLSGFDRLQFGAIGAANLLPKEKRLELARPIEEAVGQSAPGSATRRLGQLFLKHNK